MMLVIVSGVASGCSWLPARFANQSGDTSRAQMERLVAGDFAAAFAQIPESAPEAGSLQMSRPETPFGTALLVALRGEGYRLGYDDKVPTGRDVLYQIDSEENPFGSSLGYRVNLGEVSLSRDYMMKSTGVFPQSFMRVEGADATGLNLYDERFRRQAPDEIVITGVTSDASLSGVTDLPAGGGGNGADGAGKATALPMITDVGGNRIVDKQRVELVNMRETLRSNYSELLDTYGSVDRQVLTFPDDSLRVLPEVRAALRGLQRQFDPATDVFSVIGCSHGSTRLEDGNRLLALGRSKRVLEELITMGVPDKLVLDEGCWAGEHFEKMPPRGVVVELKRRGAG